MGTAKNIKTTAGDITIEVSRDGRGCFGLFWGAGAARPVWRKPPIQTE